MDVELGDLVELRLIGAENTESEALSAVTEKLPGLGKYDSEEDGEIAEKNFNPRADDGNEKSAENEKKEFGRDKDRRRRKSRSRSKERNRSGSRDERGRGSRKEENRDSSKRDSPFFMEFSQKFNSKSAKNL